MINLNKEKQILAKKLVNKENFKIIIELIESLKKDYENVVVYGKKEVNDMIFYSGKAQALKDLIETLTKVGNTKE